MPAWASLASSFLVGGILTQSSAAAPTNEVSSWKKKLAIAVFDAYPLRKETPHGTSFLLILLLLHPPRSLRLLYPAGMTESCSHASPSSSSSLNSSFHDDTEDDQTIAAILAEEESSTSDGKLGKRLSHLDSIPHTPRVIGEIPDVNEATLDHERLSERLVTYDLEELQIEGDGNCQFRALADQLFGNSDHHKFVRKEVIKQLKHERKLYEGYVPMKYKSYLKKMKKSGEWGDHVTLQAAADRDTSYVEIVPHGKNPAKELWLSFWSEVHYNSLYERGDVPARKPRKKHWLF